MQDKNFASPNILWSSTEQLFTDIHISRLRCVLCTKNSERNEKHLNHVDPFSIP